MTASHIQTTDFRSSPLNGFSFDRLLMLLRMEWIFNGRDYLLAFGFFLALIIAFSYLNVLSGMLLIMTIIMVFYVIYYVQIVHGRIHASSELSIHGIPANTMERWLYLIIMGVVLALSCAVMLWVGKVMSDVNGGGDYAYRRIGELLSSRSLTFLVMGWVIMLSSFALYIFIVLRKKGFGVAVTVFAPVLLMYMANWYSRLLKAVGIVHTEFTDVLLPGIMFYVLSALFLVASFHALKKIQFRS